MCCWCKHFGQKTDHVSSLKMRNPIFFLPQCHHMSLMDFVVFLPGCGWSVTDFKVGTSMRRSYVVPMRWMVIYEYEVQGRAFNLGSAKLPRLWSPWESSLSRKSPHGRTGNRTRYLMFSSRKLTTRPRGWSRDPKIVSFIFFCILIEEYSSGQECSKSWLLNVVHESIYTTKQILWKVFLRFEF
jgi:hypothetical protein